MDQGKKPGLSYRDAGVDIERGSRLVERIKPIAQATRRPGVMGGLGGFGALFRPLRQPSEHPPNTARCFSNPRLAAP